MFLAAALVAVLQATATPQPTTPPPDTFLDPDAAAMVAGARARTRLANDRIAAYQAVAKQRLSVRIRGLRRDRLVYRREVASRVDWRRDGPRTIEVLGSRQASEVARPGEEPFLGGDLISAASGMAFDPATEWLLRIPAEGVIEDTDGGTTSFVHPLAPGSERHYRFRAGETTSIRLEGGRTIRLRELQVLPRRSQSNLVTGSLWLEEDTHAAVRGVFTLAAPVTFSIGYRPGSISLGTDGGTDIGSARLAHLTIEYGLWEGEWWLPRLMAVEGSVEFGRFTLPLVMEQLFEDFRIFADADVLPAQEPVDTTRFEVEHRGCAEDEECTERYVLVPRDTSVLLDNDHLPGSIYDDTRLVTDAELEQLVEMIDRASWRSMLFRRPRFDWNPLDGSLIHYNRVEGLTLGTSMAVDLQPLSLSAAAAVGTADRSPKFQVDFSRARYDGQETFGAYRRVEAFTPEDKPFSIGSSLSSFALGHDDGDYYRTTGVSFTSEQTPASASSVRTRIYAERQTPVENRTNISLPNLFGEHSFRTNPQADPADQLGVDIRARLGFGASSAGLRGGLEARLQAERGTFSIARPSGSAYLAFPLLERFILGADGAIGTSFGDLPLQSRWYIGGPSTVRGFRPEDRVSGEAFWRGRAEIGTDFPAARLVLFSDAGWAGARTEFVNEPSLISVGIGASFLDGLLRTDLTRTVRGGPGRWGLQLQLDAIF